MQSSTDFRPCGSRTPDSRASGSSIHRHPSRDLRIGAAALALVCALSAGCATTAPSITINSADAQRLAEVTAVAGKPVSSFRFLSMSSFEPIGDQDLLVFTSPRSAWLLHLDGYCRDLDFDPFLGLTSTFNRVSAGFDSVVARGNPIPCRIQQIRPLDTAVLRRAEKERKAQAEPASGPATSG